MEGKVKYKDKTVDAFFIFDTGTETVAMSKELADKIGYNMDSYFSVEVSDKKTTGINATIDLNTSEHAGKSGQFDGKIFGGRMGLYPVFRNNYLVVDFRKSTIDVYTAKGGNKETSMIPTDAFVDSKVAGSMFYVASTVNGKEGLYFSFSSGISGAHVVSKYGSKKAKVKNNSRKPVQIGTDIQSEQPFSVNKSKDFSNAETKAQGFKVCGTLGMDFMKHYQWHFDCMNRKMGMRKS